VPLGRAAEIGQIGEAFTHLLDTSRLTDGWRPSSSY